MKNEIKTFARRVYSSSTNIALSKAITFGVSLYLARTLTKTDFGHYAFLYATVLLIQSIAGFAMSGTTSKYIGTYKDNPEKQDEIARFAIIIAAIGGFGGAIFYLASARLAIIQVPNNLTTDIVIACGVLAGTITPAVRGIAIGRGKIKPLTTANLLTGGIYIPTLYILTSQFGINGAINSITIYFLLELAASYLGSNPCEKRGGIRPIKAIISTHKSILSEFSLPSAISGTIIAATTWLGLSFLNNSPNGKEELAEFAIANQWRIILLLLPAVIENATTPTISYAARHEKHNLSIHLKINIVTIGGAGLAAVLTLVLAAGTILKMYGNEYIESETTFRLMILAGYAYALNAVIGQYISATGNMWHGLWLNVVWCIT